MTESRTIIEPRSRFATLNVREIWEYRDLLWTLSGRDIKLRYKQTALGVAWVIAQPLIAAAIFAFVFGRVAKLSSDGLPYFLFAYAGLLGWNVFNSTLTKVSACLVGNSQLVSKVYFPRLVLPLSTVGSTLLDFAVALALFFVMAIVHGLELKWGIVLLPVWLALLLMMAIGVGLYSAALMVVYRDLQYVIPILLQFLLYASPVAYALSSTPESLRAILMLNPLTGLFEAFRWSLLGHGRIDPQAILYSTAVAEVMFLLGALAFRQMERRFADVI